MKILAIMMILLLMQTANNCERETNPTACRDIDRAQTAMRGVTEWETVTVPSEMFSDIEEEKVTYSCPGFDEDARDTDE